MSNYRDERDAYWREQLYKMTFSEVCEWFQAHQKNPIFGEPEDYEKYSDYLSAVDFFFMVASTEIEREEKFKALLSKFTMLDGGKFN